MASHLCLRNDGGCWSPQLSSIAVEITRAAGRREIIKIVDPTLCKEARDSLITLGLNLVYLKQPLQNSGRLITDIVEVDRDAGPLENKVIWMRNSEHVS